MTARFLDWKIHSLNSVQRGCKTECGPPFWSIKFIKRNWKNQRVDKNSPPPLLTCRTEEWGRETRPGEAVQSLQFQVRAEGWACSQAGPLLVAQTAADHPLSWPGFWIGGFPEGGRGAGFESHHPGGNMTRSQGALQVIHYLCLV